jgi:hypothetical protein
VSALLEQRDEELTKARVTLEDNKRVSESVGEGLQGAKAQVGHAAMCIYREMYE